MNINVFNLLLRDKAKTLLNYVYCFVESNQVRTAVPSTADRPQHKALGKI